MVTKTATASANGQVGKITIHCDVSDLSIGDLETLELWTHGDVRMSAALDIMQRTMDDDVRAFPLAHFRDIVQAILDATGESIAEKNSEGG